MEELTCADVEMRRRLGEVDLSRIFGPIPSSGGGGGGSRVGEEEKTTTKLGGTKPTQHGFAAPSFADSARLRASELCVLGAQKPRNFGYFLNGHCVHVFSTDFVVKRCLGLLKYRSLTYQVMVS